MLLNEFDFFILLEFDLKLFIDRYICVILHEFNVFILLEFDRKLFINIYIYVLLDDVFILIEFDLNTLRSRQDGRRFPDDTFERIFLNENVIILIKISLKFVPYGPINNIPALVQIMAWRRSGDKPLSEPMVGRLPTHICVTRPQWVKLFMDRYICVLLNEFNVFLFHLVL